MIDLGLGNGLGGGPKKDGFGEVEVQWGKEKIRVPLPPPNSPLSSFKDTLYNITGVPPSHMKLIYSGAILKDDLAPLSSYDLVDTEPTAAADASTSTSFWDSWSFRSTSTRKLKKLVLLGSKTTSAVVNDHLSSRRDLLLPGSEEVIPPKPVDDEPTVISRINALCSGKLAELTPSIEGVEAYLADLKGEKGADEPAPPPNPRALIFVSEALLQALLKLDGIDIPSGYTEARAERKKGVRSLQDSLDRVDSLKIQWKEASKKGEQDGKL